MNSMAISTKMIESDEYKDTRAALDYMLVMLRQQLVITKDIMEEYERLKIQANIDLELLKQLIESFKDIKAGRVKRVK